MLNYKRLILHILLGLLITYMVFLVVESINPGFVTFYFDMSYLLFAGIVLSVISFWLYFANLLDYIERKPGDKRTVSTIKHLLQNKSFVLLLILISGIAIRGYFAAIGPINLDEGNGIYDAHMVKEGNIPFKDFVTRDPGYLYALALFVKIFGWHIMTARLLAVVASGITCFFIYRIGKELYNTRIGLIASLIYSIGPIFIYQDIIGYLRAASFMWIPVSVYFLILALKTDKYRYYFLHGLLIGIALLFYRGYFVYLMLCPLVLFCLRFGHLRNLVKYTGTVFMGFCIVAAPVLAYYILQTNAGWMWSQYAPPQFISFSLEATVGTPVSYISAKSRQLYVLFRGALYIAIPLLLFFTLWLKNRSISRGTYLILLSLIWSVVLLLVVRGKFVEWYEFEQQPMPANYPTLFFLLLITASVISVYFLINTRFKLNINPNISLANTFLGLWFVCSSFYYFLSPVRSDIGIIAATIMSALILSQIFQVMYRKSLLPTAFFIVLTLSMIFSAFAYINTPNPDRGIKLSTLSEVSAYIEGNTSPDEEILTAIPAFAVEAHRRIIFDISHPLFYATTDNDPSPYDPFDLIPTITEIQDYLYEKKVNYIVADPRTISLFISDRHPELKYYITSNYKEVLEVDNVAILRRIE